MPAAALVATNEYHTSSSAVPGPAAPLTADCVAPNTVPLVGAQVLPGLVRAVAAAHSSLAGTLLGRSTQMIKPPAVGVSGTARYEYTRT